MDDPSSLVANTSVNVIAPTFRPCRLSLGAIYNQLKMKPETVAGKIQIAGNPHKYAAPLTPSNVHAEDEDAEALRAATHGPSFRPPENNQM